MDEKTITYKLQIHFLRGFLNGFDKAISGMHLNRQDIENKITDLNKLINGSSEEPQSENSKVDTIINKKFEKIKDLQYILNNRQINLQQQTLINNNILRLKNEIKILKSKMGGNEGESENIKLNVEKKNNQDAELKKLIINATTIIYNFIRNNNLKYDCTPQTFKDVIRIMATENYNLLCLKGNFPNIKKTLDFIHNIQVNGDNFSNYSITFDNSEIFFEKKIDLNAIPENTKSIALEATTHEKQVEEDEEQVDEEQVEEDEEQAEDEVEEDEVKDEEDDEEEDDEEDDEEDEEEGDEDENDNEDEDEDEDEDEEDEDEDEEEEDEDEEENDRHAETKPRNNDRRAGAEPCEYKKNNNLIDRLLNKNKN